MNLVTKPVIPVTQPYQSAVHELNEIKRYGTKRYDLLRYGNDSLNRETKKSEKIDRRQPIRILEHILKRVLAIDLFSRCEDLTTYF